MLIFCFLALAFYRFFGGIFYKKIVFETSDKGFLAVKNYCWQFKVDVQFLFKCAISCCEI